MSVEISRHCSRKVTTGSVGVGETDIGVSVDVNKAVGGIIVGVDEMSTTDGAATEDEHADKNKIIKTVVCFIVIISPSPPHRPPNS
jgi:hypothetical protein